MVRNRCAKFYPHSYLAPQVRTTLLVPGHIQTPLFSTTHFPQNFLFKFFVPSLQPITIAKAVIAALDEQHSRTIYLPFYVNFVPVLRLLPSFLRDFAQWVRLDRDSSMFFFSHRGFSYTNLSGHSCLTQTTPWTVLSRSRGDDRTKVLWSNKRNRPRRRSRCSNVQ